MSGSLGSFPFDRLTGRVPLPQPRVQIYARSGVNGIGAVTQPETSAAGEIALRVHLNEANATAAAGLYRGAVGSILTLVDGSINYAVAYGVNFLVEDLSDVQVTWVQRAMGHRGGITFDLSPAGVVESRWRLRAVPV